MVLWRLAGVKFVVPEPLLELGLLCLVGLLTGWLEARVTGVAVVVDGIGVGCSWSNSWAASASAAMARCSCTGKRASFL